MTSRIPSQCMACTRFRAEKGECEAYPNGIPSDMLFFGEDHRQPRPDDRGFQFLQGQSEDQKLAFEDWQATFG